MRGRWLIAAVVLPFAGAIALALIFDVIREIPPSPGCGEEPAEGAAAYRRGSGVLHAVAALIAVGGLAVTSAARRARKGLAGVGPVVYVPLALIAILALAAVLEVGGASGLLWVAVLPAVGLVLLAGPFGAEATAVIVSLLLGAAAAWLAVNADRPRGLLLASLSHWVLLVLIAGHALVVAEQGAGPILC